MLFLAGIQVKDNALIQSQMTIRWQKKKCFYKTAQPVFQVFSCSVTTNPTVSSITGASPNFLSGCFLTKERRKKKNSKNFLEQKHNLECALKTEPWYIKLTELSCYKKKPNCINRTQIHPQKWVFLFLAVSVVSGFQ